MSENSKPNRPGVIFLLQIITYLLLVINVVVMKYYWISDLTIVFSFLISFIIIALPPAIAVNKYNIRYKNLLFSCIIIFFCVLLFSPEGFYLIIYKGDWFLTPADPNWIYGILITIEFLIVQSIGYAIGCSFKKNKSNKENNLEENIK